ncbi:tRNA nucleotidyl transferase [Pseudomonadota bacterium]|nr:tRNA nucleotidyl transferase [Pseudomonadota bacterium]
MKVFQVGGSVRDELLGVEPKDRDWVVVNSSPEEMEEKGFRPIGKDFPVFLHPETNEEYALARTERKSGVGYKGFEFYFDSSVTLEDDLKRRDFTINSIAKDENGNIIDPFKGRLDLQNKVFKHTSPAFEEDPLRVLRFARFKAYVQLHDFNLDEETEVYFEKIIASKELKDLSPERVWMETKKALENKFSSEFFKAVIDYHLTDPWFAGLKNISCDGDLPELKWADMQRINCFQLCASLPIPNSYIKVQEFLKQVINLIACKEKSEKLKLVEKINVRRNYEILMHFKQYQYLDKHQDYLEKIFKSVMSIDFSVLANFNESEVSNQKQLLYHEALQEII